MSELSVTRTLHIAAHPSTVWAALTQAELISEWFGETATIDLRVGGAGVMGFGGDGDFSIIVEEVTEPVSFAYRWAHEPGADPAVSPSTLVRFTLVETDSGTQLTVVETGWEQFGAESAHFMGLNTEGWLEELDELRSFLEKQDSA
ncbi:MAG TPA: SRPBCC domain-containing protein [Galbitalea sp.]|jgi:uncharacterized protein YndB with AHSA1/START domain|nr:SRPBCC domain-containing protein [Galbitalea sp.]